MEKINIDQGEQIDILDVYNSEGVYLGKENRKTVHDKGLLHYAIHCWVWNEENNTLTIAFQKRKQNKRLFPGKYDVVAAGHYLSGEFGKDGLRELAEELGLPLSMYDIIYYDTKACQHIDSEINNNELFNVYFCHLNSSFHSIRFENSEIDDIVVGDAVDFLNLFSGVCSEVSVRSLSSNTHMHLALDAFISDYKDYFVDSISALIKMQSKGPTCKKTQKYYSFIMLKPDAIDRGLVSQIVSYLTSRNLSIEAINVLCPEDETVYMHYSEKIDEEGDLYKVKAYRYFHGKMVVPIVLSAKSANIIQYVRELIGYKDPTHADKATIRGRWGIDSMELSEREVRCCENLIHACDSREAFKKEVTLWFKRDIAERFLM